MKHLTLKEFQGSAVKDVPEGEIFSVHDQQPANKSIYVLTPTEFVEVFAFACKIKGQLYTSAWVGENQDKSIARDAMKQILFIKKGGWYDTGEKRMDELNLHREPLFRCAWCGNETTEVKGACICRRVAAGMTNKA